MNSEERSNSPDHKKTLLHLCFCIHDPSGEYYKNTLTAMLSVFENTSRRLCVHLFCDETLRPDGKEAFAKLGRKFGQELRFYPMQDISQKLLGKIPEIFGRGSLYRLFIPELIHEESLLYLDSDIICTIDIQEIFTCVPEGHCLGGVADLGQQLHRYGSRKLRRLGIDPSRYINSGVLLMNLRKIRQEHPAWREEIFALLNRENFTFPDQDALNLYFSSHADGIALLPEHFNYCVNIRNRSYLDTASYQGKILHYTKEKPWHVLTSAALLYWQYHTKLFHYDNIVAELRELRSGSDLHLYDFILRNETVKRLVGKLYLIDKYGLVATLKKKLRIQA